MILDVSRIIRIPDADMKLSFEEKVDFIESKTRKIKLIEPIRFSGTIVNDGKVLCLKGDLSTVLELYCDRCTKPVPTSLSIEVEEKFSSDPIDEEEIHMVSGNEIDLKPIFVNVILLNMPMKVVCSEECKGICLQCGQNLNNGACGCKEEELDPRFSVLRTLFNESE